MISLPEKYSKNVFFEAFIIYEIIMVCKMAENKEKMLRILDKIL